MNSLLADKLCVFPVLQQVIGVATVLPNLVLVIIDLVKSIFCQSNRAKGASMPRLNANQLKLIAREEAAKKEDEDLSELEPVIPKREARLKKNEIKLAEKRKELAQRQAQFKIISDAFENLSESVEKLKIQERQVYKNFKNATNPEERQQAEDAWKTAKIQHQSAQNTLASLEFELNSDKSSLDELDQEVTNRELNYLGEELIICRGKADHSVRKKKNDQALEEIAKEKAAWGGAEFALYETLYKKKRNLAELLLSKTTLSAALKENDELNLPEDSQMQSSYSQSCLLHERSLREYTILMRKIAINDKPIFEHLKQVGIGFLRITPIVSTIYSSIVWYKN